MYEKRAGHSSVADAIELIKAAPYVCFLGFGFDPDNITRLNLNHCCAGKPSVLATRYQIEVGDWNRIVGRMSPTTLNQATAHFDMYSKDWDCLAFLHQTSALG